MTALELLGAVLVATCAPLVLLIATVGVAWTIRRRRDVAASPLNEAHDEGARRTTADHGAAAATLHRLPARRDDRDALADRAPRASLAGRADDDRELRPVAHLVPVVQASLQPVGRWNPRRGEGERQARRDSASSTRTPALVRAIETWGMAGLVPGAAPVREAVR